MTGKSGAKSTADEVLSGVDLKGKRFLITGASSGIGLETARSLIAHGASVVGAVRDLAKAERAMQSARDTCVAKRRPHGVDRTRSRLPRERASLRG